MITLASLQRRIEAAARAVPALVAERGYTSEQMIQRVHALLASMEELDAAGLRWPRETPLTPSEQTVYERILTAHGIPTRKEPLTAEELAFIERVEKLAAEALAAEAPGEEVQP